MAVSAPDGGPDVERARATVNPETSSSSEPSADDHAMLSFQETMQSFLQTQQEVMAAYLSAQRRSFVDD